MAKDKKARIKGQARSLSLTGIIVALSVGVLFPVLLSTAVGIVTLALGESESFIVIGVLVVSFAAAAVGSVIAVTVLLSKRARTARLQSDLLANVTHDLRTPLTAIQMYAQTLKMGKLKHDPERTQEILDTIIRETKWLEAMIERVLTWRAASRDRDVLEMKSASLREATEEAYRRFSRMVPPGEVELSLQIDTEAPVLHDSHSISSVVLNLLINAYKYTTTEKKIHLNVQEQDGMLAVSVEDNGIGIRRREMQKIFEPFYRIDSSLKGKSTGAGLGLAIVQHLVRMHRGEVNVESSKDKGSRFTVLLPKSEAQDSR